MEKITIAELDIDLDKVLKSSSDLKIRLDALKAANRELTKSGQAGSAQFVENDANIRNLSKAYRQNQQVASGLISINSDLAAAQELEGKAVTQVRNERDDLIKIVNSLNGTTEEEIQLRNNINATIDKQTEFIRENSSEYNAAKDGIGEYSRAIQGAIPSNSALGQAIAISGEALKTVRPIYNLYSAEVKGSISGIVNAAKGTQGLTAAQKAQAIATNVTTNALKLFRVALISTGIGAILVALGSLVSFLATTQEGIDKVNKVLKPLEVIFSRLSGVFQVFGKRLFDAFSNPRETISKLGDIIKNNLINRFTALQNIINRIINFDFDGIGDDFLQAATGVEDFADKAGNAFSEVKGFIEDSIATGTELANLAIQIEETENQLVLDKARLNAEFEKQKEIAQDVSNTQQQRLAASREAVTIQDQLLAKERELLDLKINEKEINNSLNDTSRADQKELNDLVAQRTNLEANAARKRVSARNLQKTIDREIQAAARKAAEDEKRDAEKAARVAVENLGLELETFKIINAEKLAADGELNRARITAALEAEAFIRDSSLAIIDQKLADGVLREEQANLERLKAQEVFNQRSGDLNREFEAQQEEERLARVAADMEREALEEEARLELRSLKAEDQFEFQREQLELQRVQEVANAEKLGADTTAIEERFAIRKRQIDDAVQANKLNAASQVFGQLADLAGKESFIGKAAGIAQASIDTYVGANRALATLPPPFGQIAAGLTIASGLANVAKISGVSTKFKDGGLQQIGGKRHSAGGTKFMGEDGTAFEAERGELIGVMSRKASAAFMSFNNLFTNGKSRSGRYEQGGAINPSTLSLVQSRFNTNMSRGAQGSNNIDYERLAGIVVDGVSSLPNPIVGVEDINTGQSRVAQVVDNANV